MCHRMEGSGDGGYDRPQKEKDDCDGNCTSCKDKKDKDLVDLIGEFRIKLTCPEGTTEIIESIGFSPSLSTEPTSTFTKLEIEAQKEIVGFFISNFRLAEYLSTKNMDLSVYLKRSNLYLKKEFEKARLKDSDFLRVISYAVYSTRRNLE